MLRLGIIVVLAMLLPSVVLAKRGTPVKVEPVILDGVRYVAPNDDGLRAYVQAWDIQTSQKLWELTVFTNRIDPILEEDVQWVFIKKMKAENGTLIVTSERGKVYRIDLKKKSVTVTLWPNIY